MPLSFSVITPSFNQGQFIERTIQSVLSQTGVEFNYMVCDGGSSDNTVDILRQYQDWIQWVSEPDAGQADAVNKGIQNTMGDIIAWINSDDIYYPNALKKVRQIFETHPAVQVVYGDANHIDEVDQIIEPYPTEPWNYQHLKDICFICQPATFFRRELVDTHGLLSAQLKYCMDYELWLRFGQYTDFYYLPEVLAGSRFYENTKTLGQRTAVHFEINEMLKDKFGISPEKWVLAYASILVDEKAKKERRDPSDLQSQVIRMNEFFVESFNGYARWRSLRFSPSTIWRLSRWTLATYYRYFRSNFFG
jgi:glycosyltransferase involved in cell wall biosynthesis